MNKLKTNTQLPQAIVSKSVFVKLNKQMEKQFKNYNSAKGTLEAFLSDYIDFDFCVQDMAGDGFTILDYDNSKVASVESCFEIIFKNGKLTKDDLATVSF
ncbi:hypothetical protein [Flavobacterium fluviatile]|uniref:hypothetical protein n=1 Tax=Flavobacterium fluviatile TaxID=1862387 RepID=UPI0013D46B13|nr:hypothetical protein [Flavobacterium fluviatile]